MGVEVEYAISFISLSRLAFISLIESELFTHDAQQAKKASKC